MSNQVILMFKTDTSKDTVKRIVKELDGKVDEDALSDINMYQMIFNSKKFDTLDEINNYCNTIINKYEDIDSCNANMLYELDIE